MLAVVVVHNLAVILLWWSTLPQLSLYLPLKHISQSQVIHDRGASTIGTTTTTNTTTAICTSKASLVLLYK